MFTEAEDGGPVHVGADCGQVAMMRPGLNMAVGASGREAP